MKIMKKGYCKLTKLLIYRFYQATYTEVLCFQTITGSYQLLTFQSFLFSSNFFSFFGFSVCLALLKMIIFAVEGLSFSNLDADDMVFFSISTKFISLSFVQVNKNVPCWKFCYTLLWEGLNNSHPLIPFFTQNIKYKEKDLSRIQRKKSASKSKKKEQKCRLDRFSSLQCPSTFGMGEIFCKNMGICQQKKLIKKLSKHISRLSILQSCLYFLILVLSVFCINLHFRKSKNLEREYQELIQKYKIISQSIGKTQRQGSSDGSDGPVKKGQDSIIKQKRKQINISHLIFKIYQEALQFWIIAKEQKLLILNFDIFRLSFFSICFSFMLQ